MSRVHELSKLDRTGLVAEFLRLGGSQVVFADTGPTWSRDQIIGAIRNLEAPDWREPDAGEH